MKFIELFAGIGGFRFGLEKANDTVTEGTQQGIRQRNKSNDTIVKSFLGTKQFSCVFANEWNKCACQVYRKNFGDKELIEGDIRNITAKSIPNHDLLTAGFPCQSFSIAGKRKGFGDTRGTLFFEICRIVEEKKPNLLFLENVKGLLNHDGGNTFRIILDSLSELGYDCEWEVLNSKNFGVPQNRERVFIIGHLRGKGKQKVFPLGKKFTKDSELAKQTFKQNRTWGGTLRARGTTSFGSGDVFIKNETAIRRLTPIECERLQGFPDGWTEGISDSQRYKCLGNAVTTNVVEEIGRKILEGYKIG